MFTAQVGGAPYLGHSHRALLPWPQWPQGLLRQPSWHRWHALRGTWDAHMSGTLAASQFRFTLRLKALLSGLTIKS